jgi:hypothetical protein
LTPAAGRSGSRLDSALAKEMTMGAFRSDLPYMLVLVAIVVTVVLWGILTA